jgi:hypothetical protein
MSDILIPMADSRGHDMQDDCAEWAQENVRPFIAQGCDQQGRHKPTIEPDPVNAVMGMDDDYSAADKEHSSFVTGVLMLVIYGLSALAAVHAFWLIVETLVEAAP